MKRTEKYPNTSYFTYYNANPHNRVGADCVVRAISVGLDKSWETVVREMTELGIKKGYLLSDKHLYTEYLNKVAVKQSQCIKADHTKYTGREFCDLLAKMSCNKENKPRVIAHIGGHHLVCFVPTEWGNYTIYDIWDSTDGTVGNFWVIE